MRQNDLPVFGNLAISNISTIVGTLASLLNINLLKIHDVVHFQIENI
jgi:hypothetical protein